ncbi:MAG: DUF502 domain-containing protein [Fusobacteriaceae bacterium]
MKKTIKSYFYTGLISILPIILTLYILDWFLTIIIDLISTSFVAVALKEIISTVLKLGKEKVYQEVLLNLSINTISIVTIILTITLTGYTLKNVFFASIAKRIENLFANVPLVKHIYSTINQIVGVVSSNKNSNYQKVVVLEYPRKGVYSLGFLTSENNGILENALNKKQICNIFIPTSPNPTSGMFVAIPVEDIKILDIKVDDAVKLIISGGVIVPNYKKEVDNEKTTSKDTKM